MKKIVILLLIPILLIGCNKEKINGNKQEELRKYNLNSLDEKTIARIEELEKEKERINEEKENDTAKCRMLEYGGAAAYDKCIKEAYNKLNEARIPVIKEINSYLYRLTLKENTLKKDGLVAIIENYSEYEFTYGEPFILEKLENNEYKEVDLGLNFNLPAYQIAPLQAKVIDINFGKELDLGSYRITKTLVYEEKTNINVYLEFEIK